MSSRPGGLERGAARLRNRIRIAYGGVTALAMAQRRPSREVLTNYWFLMFVAHMTGSGNVCAWVDVCDGLDPESAAAAGVDLKRLLWTRCGAAKRPAWPDTEAAFRLPPKYLVLPAIREGLHGGGFGPHPRTEGKGISAAIGNLLWPEQLASRCAEPQPRPKLERETIAPISPEPALRVNERKQAEKPWSRIEQGREEVTYPHPSLEPVQWRHVERGVQRLQ